ncbi:DUF1828 domain-containing protein [Carnobacterium maltaromaticum]|uniref:DUF1828 domain-containing protein n=1 Tax=Carnobacterium maltaromaticum TaxID=2751 RepID=UPI00165C5D95|nr:DUF1828 domain-containing protein [Carnobacterium maltaromaticum]MBC9808208.1 DUF1828 domain-containing protein [Carnobacterium maltaromaticum]
MDATLKLVEDYFSWYKSNFKITKLKTADQILTPFVNHLNDRIYIYVEILLDGHYRISDDGTTINELNMLGIDLSTFNRQKIIRQILISFGIKLENDVLFTITDAKNSPKSMHNLLQAIMKVYDLSVTKRSNIIGMYYDEVSQYLFENEFGGSLGMKATGESGLDYHIDYTLGATKNRPDTMIQFINNMDFDSIAKQTFIYNDIYNTKAISNNGFKYALVANDVTNKVPEKAITAAEATNMEIIFWSKKEKLLQLK